MGPISLERRAECIMSTIDEHGFWVGVAEVIPRVGNDLLEDADGAYVGVVGIAGSEPEFISKAGAAFSAMDFDMLELEDLEFVRSAEQWTNADDSIREKLSLLNSQNPIEVGAFHCFKN